MGEGNDRKKTCSLSCHLPESETRSVGAWAIKGIKNYVCYGLRPSIVHIVGKIVEVE